MEIKVGDRVRMQRTKNIGTVTAALEGGHYQVRLDDGMGHLPIPGDLLIRVAFAPPATTSAAPAPPPTPRAHAAPDQDGGAGTGVQLIFDPILDADGDPESYQLYLINGTRQKLVYELKVLTGDHKRQTKMGQVPKFDRVKFDTVPYAWLNERLILELDVRTLNLDGTGPRHFHQLRVRAKQFFANYTDVPELNREAHRYTVFTRLDGRSVSEKKAGSGPSLKAVTREQQRKTSQEKSRNLRPADLSLQDRAEFEEVLDLHLPALVKNPSAIPKHQVLATQMKFFEEYIDQAVRLGVDRVFVIHGVGNGVLKREVQKRLKYVPFVRTYKNEYHHKYGYGATEVIFD